jgi:hypothetical protein
MMGLVLRAFLIRWKALVGGLICVLMYAVAEAICNYTLD